MELIWHYTTGININGIIRDKVLKVSEESSFGIKPTLWFSKNPVWEPSATKTIFEENEFVELSPEEQTEILGMFRIGIEYSSELISWAKYKHVNKVHPMLYMALEKEGQMQGANPDDWYCSFKNIHSSQWKAKEKYDGTDWLPFTKTHSFVSFTIRIEGRTLK